MGEEPLPHAGTLGEGLFSARFDPTHKHSKRIFHFDLWQLQTRHMTTVHILSHDTEWTLPPARRPASAHANHPAQRE